MKNELRIGNYILYDENCYLSNDDIVKYSDYEVHQISSINHTDVEIKNEDGVTCLNIPNSL